MLMQERPFLLETDYRGFNPRSDALYLKTVTQQETLSLLSVMLLGLFIFGAALAGFILTEREHYLFRTQGVETQMLVAYCNTIATTHKRSATTYTANLTLAYNVNYKLTGGNVQLPGRCESYPKDMAMTGVYLKTQPTRILLMTMAQLNLPFAKRLPNFYGGLAVAVAGLLMFIVELYIFVDGRIKRGELYRKGQLIDGEVIRSRSWYAGRRRHHTHFHRRHIFYVSVNYQFQSPSGRTLKGWQRNRRDDLSNMTTPESPRRVLVLYASDNNYVML